MRDEEERKQKASIRNKKKAETTPAVEEEVSPPPAEEDVVHLAEAGTEQREDAESTASDAEEQDVKPDAAGSAEQEESSVGSVQEVETGEGPAEETSGEDVAEPDTATPEPQAGQETSAPEDGTEAVELEGWDALENMVQKELHAVEAEKEEVETGEVGGTSEKAPGTADEDTAAGPSEQENSAEKNAPEPEKEAATASPRVSFSFDRSKLLWGVGGVVLFVLVAFVVHLFIVAGQFKSLDPRIPGELRQISPLIGAEDIAIDRQRGWVFFSSDDRRAVARGQNKQGTIYGLNMNAPARRLIRMTRDFRGEFHPHGISLFINEDGQRRLFVVNHRHDGHSIEAFALQNERWVHLGSVQNPLMHSPNDVVGVGLNQFYVTNDHGNTSTLGRTAEEYLRLARSNVLFFDGERFTVVAEGLKYANGINVSPDGRFVYVAATVDGKVYVYSREAGTGSLMYRYDIEFDSGVDNIDVDEQGNLWVAAHPKLLTFVRHSKNARVLSPSQVFRVEFTGMSSYRVEEIFLDTGASISGASVAAPYGNNLFIGSVFDDHVLVCLLPDSLTHP